MVKKIKHFIFLFLLKNTPTISQAVFHKESYMFGTSATSGHCCVMPAKVNDSHFRAWQRLSHNLWPDVGLYWDVLACQWAQPSLRPVLSSHSQGTLVPGDNGGEGSERDLPSLDSNNFLRSGSTHFQSVFYLLVFYLPLTLTFFFPYLHLWCISI